MRVKLLKGKCREIIDFRFFNESVSPQAPKYPQGPFQIFSKILGDIRSSWCTPGVVDTESKWKKLQSEKFYTFCLELTYR